MQTRLNHSTGRRCLGSGPPAAALALLLTALPATAQTDTPYTATGWLTGVPVPGVLFTNALGEVGLRGNAHTLRVQSTDARLTGQRLAFADGAYQADGTALVWGTAYQEVGTFDAANNFTATGGLWEMTYRGTMPADNSLQLHIVGRGSGGSIEGWRFEEDLTKAAGAPWDPADPYPYTGTIKPPPLNTSEVVDNFDDDIPAGWTADGSGPYFPPLETNQQFTVRGNWPGLVTHEQVDTWKWPYLRKNWSVANNQTLECRVDLVRMSENATNAAGCIFWSDSAGGSYLLLKGRDFIQVGKWVEGGSGGVAVFFHELAVIKNTNVILSLALTRVNPNVVLTVRVLDKDNQAAVLYQRSVVDTPQADPALTSAELSDLSGMNLNVFADSGAPRTSGNLIMLSAFQYTDGTQPQLDVTYDNLELRTSEIPPLGIGQLVALTWPDVGSYSVEGAPSVQGPWLPVNDTVSPGMKQTTVPASQPAQFFRLR